ncbi:methyltransferase family protein [Aurantivibrio infirmus]
MSEFFFYSGLFVHVSLLLIIIASKRFFGVSVWPPPNTRSWQYWIVFWSLRIMLFCIFVLAVEQWGALSLSTFYRFYISLPIFIVFFSFGSIGVLNLGWKNTHGEAMGFVNTGMYRFSRNPQYVCYAISFVALGIVISSSEALALLGLTSLWYLIAPFSEEKWLEENYGDSYLEYRANTPRYFNFGRRIK